MSNIPRIGEIFDGKYQILEILGNGGAGAVLKALQLDCKRTLALKILYENTALDAEYRARFVREAQALSQVQHDNIVCVYHLGVTANAVPYMAMEYVDGKSIRAILNSIDRMPVIQSLTIIRDAARALSHVHKQGIIHRDLKPENILVAQSPEPDTVKLVDFGLARVRDWNDQRLTSTGELIGTCSYMSPEQCKGKAVDFRSDIYSLSACLYEMVVGEKVFTADSPVGLMYKQINEPVPVVSSLQVDVFHEAINAIIQRGMSKEPQDRFANMEELANAIDEGPLNAPVSKSNGVRKSLLIYPVVALAACFIVVLIVCIVPRSEVSHENNDRASEGLMKPKGDTSKERRLKDALARSEKFSGPDSPNVAAKLVDLVAFYKEQHNYEKAEPLLKRLLIAREKGVGPAALPVADVLIDLAQIYSSRGDYGQAERLYKRALSVREKALSSDHLRVAYVLTELAQIYSSHNNFAEAEPLFERSVAIYKKSHHQNLTFALQDLASCYRSQGRKVEAEKLEMQVRALRGKGTQ